MPDADNMKRAGDATRRGLIYDLYQSLISRENERYEALRDQLIVDFGYDTFFDLQSAAAQRVCTPGHSCW